MGELSSKCQHGKYVPASLQAWRNGCYKPMIDDDDDDDEPQLN